MECITLISSPEYPEKRIGYLGLMMLLDEDQEVLPLVEHSLKKYEIITSAFFLFKLKLFVIEALNHRT